MSKLIAVILLVLLGYHFGAGSVDPKIVKVPGPERVITQNVPGPTKTVTVTKELPASCVEALAAFDTALESSRQVTRDAGSFNILLDRFGSAVGIDAAKLTQAHLDYMKLRQDVNGNATEQMTATQDATAALERCKEDTK